MTDPVHWHALPAAAVLDRLASDPLGLTEQEAAVRLARYGPNAFRVARPVSAWVILLRQFRSVMIVLLLAAAIIAYLMADLLDAGAILAVLAINVVIGFATELRAHRALSNRYALAAVLVAFGLQVMAVSLAPLAQVLRLSSLSGKDWLVVLGLALVPAVAGQTMKTVQMGRRSASPAPRPPHHGF